MKKIDLYLFCILILFSCNKENKKDSSIEVIDDALKIEKTNSVNEDFFEKDDSINKITEKLPIHGKLEGNDIEKYYPKILDTISDIRIIGSEKIKLSPGNEIIVSLLHNTGTFDELILCTHNSKLNLIDNLYIGKATDFDNGKSLTINYSILDNNDIEFNLVNWGYVGEEIDTIKYKRLVVKVNNRGLIKKL